MTMDMRHFSELKKLPVFQKSIHEQRKRTYLVRKMSEVATVR